MRRNDKEISRAAALMGKRGWKARVKKYGLKALQQRMKKIGKEAQGRPRLPDDKVKPATLYQRQRRARLRAARTLKGGKQSGKSS